MTLHRKTLSSLLAAAMLAGSSFAFAAEDKPGNADNDMNRNETTGSITNDGRTGTPEERERCMTAPADDPGCRGVNPQ